MLSFDTFWFVVRSSDLCESQGEVLLMPFSCCCCSCLIEMPFLVGTARRTLPCSIFFTISLFVSFGYPKCSAFICLDYILNTLLLVGSDFGLDGQCIRSNLGCMIGLGSLRCSAASHQLIEAGLVLVFTCNVPAYSIVSSKCSRTKWAWHTNALMSLSDVSA